MRTGEVESLNFSQHTFISQFLSRLCSHGSKRRNYQLFEKLVMHSRLSLEKDVYIGLTTIIDQLILRVTMLEISQRGKKFPVPLPTSRKLAISTFIASLIKLARKNNISHRDLSKFVFNALNESKYKKGVLFTAKQDAYALAKQNSFAVRKLYVAKNNKKISSNVIKKN